MVLLGGAAGDRGLAEAVAAGVLCGAARVSVWFGYGAAAPVLLGGCAAVVRACVLVVIQLQYSHRGGQEKPAAQHECGYLHHAIG